MLPRREKKCTAEPRSARSTSAHGRTGKKRRTGFDGTGGGNIFKPLRYRRVPLIKELIMTIRIILIWICCAQVLKAQELPLPMGAGNEAEAMAPGNVHASDGVYDKFVLVRWEAGEQSGQFRVFRALSVRGASMQELTAKPQKSTWFCDYSAEKGRDYYYAISEVSTGGETQLTPFDKGFIRKDGKLVMDESLSAVPTDKVAAGKQVYVLIEEIQTDTSVFRAGETVAYRLQLSNLFDETTPRTDIKIYLSTDNTWDFEDQLLVSKSYSGFPGSTRPLLKESLELKNPLVPGNYFLIAVAAPQGQILEAKTAVTPLTIIAK